MPNPLANIWHSDILHQAEVGEFSSPKGSPEWFYWRGMLYALREEWRNNPPQYAETLLKLETRGGSWQVARIRCDELTGAELDAAVARLEGWRPVDWTAALTTWTNGQRFEILGGLDFSQDWALGGPIIERERIMIEHSNISPGYWWAWLPDQNGEYAESPGSRGPTPLIAAMRAFVASKAIEREFGLGGNDDVR